MKKLEMTDALIHSVTTFKTEFNNAHFTQRATEIKLIRRAHSLSEREMSKLLGVSKTEINRLLKIADLPPQLLVAARAMKTDKYVLTLVAKYPHDTAFYYRVMDGHIKTYSKARMYLKARYGELKKL